MSNELRFQAIDTKDQNNPGFIIQKCLTEIGTYSKEFLIDIIQTMSDDEFANFCTEIRMLQHFNDSNKGAWCTDMQSKLPDDYEKYYWQLRARDNTIPR
jgi:hypothetical protein